MEQLTWMDFLDSKLLTNKNAIKNLDILPCKNVQKVACLTDTLKGKGVRERVKYF